MPFFLCVLFSKVIIAIVTREKRTLNNYNSKICGSWSHVNELDLYLSIGQIFGHHNIYNIVEIIIICRLFLWFQHMRDSSQRAIFVFGKMWCKKQQRVLFQFLFQFFLQYLLSSLILWIFCLFPYFNTFQIRPN